MSVIAVHAQDFDPPSAAAWGTGVSPIWIHVRPNLRCGAAVAADLLSALGKDLSWHGKGRNEQSDRNLAVAWIRAIGAQDIVVSNAQHAPESALRFLAALSRECGTTTWLLYRAPIRDTTLGLIHSVASRSDDWTAIPLPEPHSPASDTASSRIPFPVPTVDFLSFERAAAESEEWSEAIRVFSDQLNVSRLSLLEQPSAAGIRLLVARLLVQAHDTSELIARLRACQLAAWKTGHLLSIDFPTLLHSQELPTTPLAELDEVLMKYRQPQRIVVNSLSARGIPLAEIQRLTVAEAADDPTLPRLVDGPTKALTTAFTALVHLRRQEGASEDAFLLVQDAKTLATYVTHATADTGINIAGRRVERVRETSRWLKQLGLTVRPLS